MDVRNQAVIDAALALPEAERVLLTHQLLDTLSEAEEEVPDEEFLAELDRRRAEVAAGTADPVPWSKLREEL